jgi:hypothetical protein
MLGDGVLVGKVGNLSDLHAVSVSIALTVTMLANLAGNNFDRIPIPKAICVQSILS